jgi:hypothetical protein
MDKQEIFNTVAAHLLKQGVKAVGDERSPVTNGCAYRGRQATKCAAGVLIPDDEYSSDFEGLSVPAIAEGCVDPRPEHAERNKRFAEMWERIGLTEHLHFIGELQQVHDNRGHDTWREALMELGQHHNLNTDVLSAP